MTGEITQITIRNVPLHLRNRIVVESRKHKRSMNNELLVILEEYFRKLDNDSVRLDRMASEVLSDHER